MELKRILIVVDPTQEAKLELQPAVAKGLALAKAAQADLELFVCDYNQYISGERFFDSPGLAKARDSFIVHRRQWLEEFAQSLPTDGVSVATSAVWDHPLHDGIVRKVLKSKPDLVLKDAHHHAALQRAIFTNTDWHLIRDCPVPLLLVKTERWPKQQRIMAAVDPMHERDAPAALDHRIVRAGQRLADLTSGELHVFHAYTPIVTVVGEGIGAPTAALPLDYTEEKIKQAHEQTLAALLSEYTIEPKNIHLEPGPAITTLRSFATGLDAGIVVMGAVSRGAIERLFIGSTAERVLGELDCDVLIVKPSAFKSPVHI